MGMFGVWLFSTFKSKNNHFDMKQITIFLTAMLALCGAAHATVLTVSNSSSNPAQYSSFHVAHEVAVAGDTIYVIGSYEDIVINKRLTVIGPGRGVSEAKFKNIILKNDENGDSSGSILNGLIVSEYVYPYVGQTISHVLIIRSFISKIYVERMSTGQVGSMVSWNFKHSFIGSSDVYGSGTVFTMYDNLNFESCIIGNFASTNTFDPLISYFTNCIILSSFRVGKAVVRNSIFTAVTGSFSVSINNSSVNNCLFFDSNITQSSLNSGGSSAFDNQYGQDPLFQLPLNSTDINSFFSGSVFPDFRLQDSSPAVGAGSDGSDMGIHGGTNPWPVSANATMQELYRLYPEIPRITDLTVLTGAVPQNGQLQIKVKATKAQ